VTWHTGECDITRQVHVAAVIARSIVERLRMLGRDDVAYDDALQYSCGAYLDEVVTIMGTPYVREVLRLSTVEQLQLRLVDIRQRVLERPLTAILEQYDSERTEALAEGGGE
jgi:hypothetical protein